MPAKRGGARAPNHLSVLGCFDRTVTVYIRDDRGPAEGGPGGAFVDKGKGELDFDVRKRLSKTVPILSIRPVGAGEDAECLLEEQLCDDIYGLHVADTSLTWTVEQHSCSIKVRLHCPAYFRMLACFFQHHFARDSSPCEVPDVFSPSFLKPSVSAGGRNPLYIYRLLLCTPDPGPFYQCVLGTALIVHGHLDRLVLLPAGEAGVAEEVKAQIYEVFIGLVALRHPPLYEAVFASGAAAARLLQVLADPPAKIAARLQLRKPPPPPPPPLTSAGSPPLALFPGNPARQTVAAAVAPPGLFAKAGVDGRVAEEADDAGRKGEGLLLDLAAALRVFDDSSKVPAYLSSDGTVRNLTLAAIRARFFVERVLVPMGDTAVTAAVNAFEDGLKQRTIQKIVQIDTYAAAADVGTPTSTPASAASPKSTEVARALGFRSPPLPPLSPGGENPPAAAAAPQGGMLLDRGRDGGWDPDRDEGTNGTLIAADVPHVDSPFPGGAKAGPDASAEGDATLPLKRQETPALGLRGLGGAAARRKQAADETIARTPAFASAHNRPSFAAARARKSGRSGPGLTLSDLADHTPAACLLQAMSPGKHLLNRRLASGRLSADGLKNLIFVVDLVDKEVPAASRGEAFELLYRNKGVVPTLQAYLRVPSCLPFVRSLLHTLVAKQGDAKLEEAITPLRARILQQWADAAKHAPPTPASAKTPLLSHYRSPFEPSASPKGKAPPAVGSSEQGSVSPGKDQGNVLSGSPGKEQENMLPGAEQGNVLSGKEQGKDQGNVLSGKEQGSVSPGKDQENVLSGKEQGSVSPGKEQEKDQGNVLPQKELGSMSPGKDQGNVLSGKEQGSVSPGKEQGKKDQGNVLPHPPGKEQPEPGCERAAAPHARRLHHAHSSSYGRKRAAARGDVFTQIVDKLFLSPQGDMDAVFHLLGLHDDEGESGADRYRDDETVATRTRFLRGFYGLAAGEAAAFRFGEGYCDASREPRREGDDADAADPGAPDGEEGLPVRRQRSRRRLGRGRQSIFVSHFLGRVVAALGRGTEEPTAMSKCSRDPAALSSDAVRRTVSLVNFCLRCHFVGSAFRVDRLKVIDTVLSSGLISKLCHPARFPLRRRDKSQKLLDIETVKLVHQVVLSGHPAAPLYAASHGVTEFIENIVLTERDGGLLGCSTWAFLHIVSDACEASKRKTPGGPEGEVGLAAVASVFTFRDSFCRRVARRLDAAGGGGCEGDRLLQPIFESWQRDPAPRRPSELAAAVQILNDTSSTPPPPSPAAAAAAQLPSDPQPGGAGNPERCLSPPPPSRRPSENHQEPTLRTVSSWTSMSDVTSQDERESECDAEDDLNNTLNTLRTCSTDPFTDAPLLDLGPDDPRGNDAPYSTSGEDDESSNESSSDCSTSSTGSSSSSSSSGSLQYEDGPTSPVLIEICPLLETPSTLRSSAGTTATPSPDSRRLQSAFDSYSPGTATTATTAATPSPGNPFYAAPAAETPSTLRSSGTTATPSPDSKRLQTAFDSYSPGTATTATTAATPSPPHPGKPAAETPSTVATVTTPGTTFTTTDDATPHTHRRGSTEEPEMTPSNQPLLGKLTENPGGEDVDSTEDPEMASSNGPLLGELTTNPGKDVGSTEECEMVPSNGPLLGKLTANPGGKDVIPDVTVDSPSSDGGSVRRSGARVAFALDAPEGQQGAGGRELILEFDQQHLHQQQQHQQQHHQQQQQRLAAADGGSASPTRSPGAQLSNSAYSTGPPESSGSSAEDQAMAPPHGEPHSPGSPATRSSSSGSDAPEGERMWKESGLDPSAIEKVNRIRDMVQQHVAIERECLDNERQARCSSSNAE
ncbi:hypothetical protein DIPPA_35109 [Diplonema papillatum]|nr:hypothetical protein DIPPA_35109 [Diplonema papillatum]KAJ9463281.1 hypothetical protein DIPPA_35109 [Diplonema papillatum]